MKSHSRPHGFALWICLVDLPCASTLPTLPNVSQLCAERACADCVTAPARGRPGVRSTDAGHATNPAQTDTQTQAQANPRSQKDPTQTDTRTPRAKTRRQTRRLRHRVLGDVHAVVLSAPSARSAAAAAATDLLPCAPCCEGTEFMREIQMFFF